MACHSTLPTWGRDVINGFALIVLGILVVAINLVIMYPNPDYEASWWKIAMATAIVVLGCALIWRERK